MKSQPDGRRSRRAHRQGNQPFDVAAICVATRLAPDAIGFQK
jgi:hypothetical protein